MYSPSRAEPVKAGFLVKDTFSENLYMIAASCIDFPVFYT